MYLTTLVPRVCSTLHTSTLFFGTHHWRGATGTNLQNGLLGLQREHSLAMISGLEVFLLSVIMLPNVSHSFTFICKLIDLYHA